MFYLLHAFWTLYARDSNFSKDEAIILAVWTLFFDF